jgi:DNA-binding response OmpR family regulator
VVPNGKDKVHKPFSSLFTDYLTETFALSSEPAKLELTGIEASLHQHLRQNPNQVCTFDQLLQEVWSHASSGPGEKEQQRRRMQVAVSRLRSKLKDAGTGEDIINIRDVGYRYVPGEA